MLEKLELGLRKVTIPLPFKLDHVHCFVAIGDKGWTVIDTGLHKDETASIWHEILGEQPLERIILTHLHPDHVGYAGTLQQKTGASVWMSERDSNDLQKIWEPKALSQHEKTYQEAALSEALIQGILANTKKFYPYVLPIPTTNRYLQDGEQIVIGNAVYEVIFTPGHSAGLVCFYNHEKGVLLSTDHVLPKITPNIAAWFYGERNPLQSFENSLNKIKQLDAAYVIPSHGEPFIGANKRMDDIWQHHEKRLDQTKEAAKETVTAMELCDILFNRKLSVYDYQFAIGETIAHLIYLVEKNILKKEMHHGVWKYSYVY